MKAKFINHTIAKLNQEKSLSSLEIKKLKYGLEGFYNLFTKLVVVVILAIILNVVKELVLLIIIYSSLRLYGFGIHAKTSLQCWLSTVPVYIGGCLFIKYVSLSVPTIYIIWVIGFISFGLFAPADTSSRPLIHKNKRIRAKILSLVILSGYLVLTYFIKSSLLLNTTLFAILMESVAINPITYKLCHASFNNYKTYQKNMV